MGNSSLHTLNKSHNRKVLNVIWLIILVSVIGEAIVLVITFIMTPTELWDVFITNMLNPTLSFLTIIIVAELAYRYFKNVDYVLITVISLLSFVTIILFPHLLGVHNVLVISIIGAAFYFERRKVYYACILVLLMFIGLYAFQESLRQKLSVEDIMLTISLFITCLILTLGVMSRGFTLLKELEKSMADRQELMIQKTFIDRISKIDALTNLYNHKTFHEYLDNLLDRNFDNKESSISMHLALMDLDNFKLINDEFGHWVGDIVLKRVASRITEGISANDFASRYGGEEFAVLFIDHSIEDVNNTLENIRIGVNEIEIPELEGKRITISIGLKSYDSRMSKQAWFTETDDLLYEAKRSGKDKVVR